MTNKTSEHSSDIDSGKRKAAITDLLDKLEQLDKQVREILYNQDNQRLALDIGIAVLAKRYPLLGGLLYGMKEVSDMKKAQAIPTPGLCNSNKGDKVSLHRSSPPPKKKSREL